MIGITNGARIKLDETKALAHTLERSIVLELRCVTCYLLKFNKHSCRQIKLTGRTFNKTSFINPKHVIMHSVPNDKLE